LAENASIFEQIDEEAEARAIAKARAEIAAGQGVSHSDVVKWLESWGSPNELRCPVQRPL
jgi:predicted transcriptional regulator